MTQTKRRERVGEQFSTRENEVEKRTLHASLQGWLNKDKAGAAFPVTSEQNPFSDRAE